MAGRGRQSAEKRRIDKLRQDQQAAKRERRHTRAEEGPAEEGPDEAELFERFRVLNEAHAAGKVSDEDFEPARHAIMVALGLEEDEG